MATEPPGEEVFGRRPDPLTTPNVLRDLARAIPQFRNIQDLLSTNLLSGLRGTLAPDVQNAVLDAANARAVGGGVGGSQFAGNIGLRDLGLTSLDVQNRAMQQALGLIPTLSNVGTVNPALQVQIQEQNKNVAAAPDPTKRGLFELNLFDKYLDKVLNGTRFSGPGSSGAPGGGGIGGVNYTNLAGAGGGGTFNPSFVPAHPGAAQANASFFGNLNPVFASGTGGGIGGINFPNQLAPNARLMWNADQNVIQGTVPDYQLGNPGLMQGPGVSPDYIAGRLPTIDDLI